MHLRVLSHACGILVDSRTISFSWLSLVSTRWLNSLKRLADVHKQYGLTHIINIDVAALITTPMAMVKQDFMAREGMLGLLRRDNIYIVIQIVLHRHMQVLHAHWEISRNISQSLEEHSAALYKQNKPTTQLEPSFLGLLSVK